MSFRKFCLALSLLGIGFLFTPNVFFAQSETAEQRKMCEESCKDGCNRSRDQCRRKISAIEGICRITGNKVICSTGKKRGCNAQHDVCTSMCFVDFGEPKPDCEPPSPPPSNPAPKDTGSSRGEPHIATYDGKGYLFQAAGDFLLTETLDGEVAVHIRQVPVNNRASSNQAIGIKIGSLHFKYDNRDSEWNVLQNGVPIPLSDFEYGPVNGVAISNPKRRGLIIVKPDTVAIRVHLPSNGRVEPFIKLLSDQRTKGLLGNRDGDLGNDINYPETNTSTWKHTVFADQWRVSQEASLLPYRVGETVDTFAIKPHPTQSVYLSEAERSNAANVCVDNNVPEHEMGMCIYDVAVTDDPSWAVDILDVGVQDVDHSVNGQAGVTERLLRHFLLRDFGSEFTIPAEVEAIMPMQGEIWSAFAAAQYATNWAEKFSIDCNALDTTSEALCSCSAAVLNDQARSETEAQRARVAFLLTRAETLSRSETMDALRSFYEQNAESQSLTNENRFVADHYRLFLAVKDQCFQG